MDRQFIQSDMAQVDAILILMNDQSFDLQSVSLQGLFGAAPGFKGQFGIISISMGMTDNELAGLIDDRHQLSFRSTSPAIMRGNYFSPIT